MNRKIKEMNRTIKRIKRKCIGKSKNNEEINKQKEMKGNE